MAFTASTEITDNAIAKITLAGELDASVAATFRGFEGLDYNGVATSLASPPPSWEALEAAKQVQREFWDL